jgi:hypothetical protein
LVLKYHTGAGIQARNNQGIVEFASRVCANANPMLQQPE